MYHGFGITQKYDGQILEQIAQRFRSKSKVRYNKQGFYS